MVFWTPVFWLGASTTPHKSKELALVTSQFILSRSLGAKSRFQQKHTQRLRRVIRVIPWCGSSGCSLLSSLLFVPIVSFKVTYIPLGLLFPIHTETMRETCYLKEMPSHNESGAFFFFFESGKHAECCMHVPARCSIGWCSDTAMASSYK